MDDSCLDCRVLSVDYSNSSRCSRSLDLRVAWALNTSEAISINTDTLQLTGGASYTGVLDPVSGVGIFGFDSISGTSLSINGTRTLGLLSRGNIAFTGSIDLLGSGGLDMGAIGSLAMKDLSAVGSGGDIQLHANALTLSGSINVFSRSLSITAATDIVFLRGTGAVPVPLPVVSPGSVTLVPVPATFLLFATGLAGLGVVKRRIN